VRILGIDPSLRGTGFGVIELVGGGRARAVEHGTILNAAGLSLGGCLVRIREQLSDVIARCHPDIAVIESTIFVQSHKSAITLGCARGAAILAVAERGIEMHEYSPREIKMAATGRGGARKEQVAFMVRATLGMEQTPSADAADALAAALAHVQRNRFRGAIAAQPGALKK